VHVGSLQHWIQSLPGSVTAITESLCCLQALRKKEFKGETSDDVMVGLPHRTCLAACCCQCLLLA